ncbi:hypothetical protein [Serinicoccus profundi]|uniref:hypothetical protein n=1 Tax=Serinicoccus profundi TaxID=1078471 RepID=UPI000255E8B3|nr:hypothetical protein [Serinicoccus profundi]
MPPLSSLIFVVIVAVWAVYLVQHWVRRREHLATARSVDRFSEAMRVLERRRALPRPDVADPAPAAYTVSPLRPARPEVTVKRGATSSAAPVARPAGSRPAVARQPVGATAVAPAPGVRRARRAAQVRAVVLLAASGVMVTLVALGVSPVLHWGWSFAGVGVLGATLLLVRRSAISQQARRRVTTARTAPRASATTPRQQVAAPHTDGAELTTTPAAQDSPLAAQARAAAGTMTARPARPARRVVDLEPARPSLFDIDEVEAGLAPAVEPEVAVADEALVAPPGSWSPTPVPPPTYTLKAKAYRGTAQPPTGSTQLPADGTEMALDEEFEDLPRIDRVG